MIKVTTRQPRHDFVRVIFFTTNAASLVVVAWGKFTGRKGSLKEGENGGTGRGWRSTSRDIVGVHGLHVNLSLSHQALKKVLHGTQRLLEGSNVGQPLFLS
jgi:hypothetical protein